MQRGKDRADLREKDAKRTPTMKGSPILSRSGAALKTKRFSKWGGKTNYPGLKKGEAREAPRQSAVGNVLGGKKDNR